MSFGGGKVMNRIWVLTAIEMVLGCAVFGVFTVALINVAWRLIA